MHKIVSQWDKKNSFISINIYYIIFIYIFYEFELRKYIYKNIALIIYKYVWIIHLSIFIFIIYIYYAKMSAQNVFYSPVSPKNAHEIDQK